MTVVVNGVRLVAGMFINQPNSFGNRMIPGPSMPMGYPQNAYPNVPPVPMDRNSGYVGNGVPGDYKPQPGFINNARKHHHHI